MPLLSFFGSIFSEDPQLRVLQITLAGFGGLFLFLLLFTLRDIVLRTRSFAYQLFCIVLVALLPGVGFLFYLLIRPARTIKERETEAMLRSLTMAVFGEGDELEEADDLEDDEEGTDPFDDLREGGTEEADDAETARPGDHEPKESEESQDSEEAGDKPEKNAHTRRRSHS